MTLLNWNEQLVLGIDSVDKQHKHLIDLTNRLEEAVSVGADKDSIIRIISGLVDYTVYHFQHEEELMMASGFNVDSYEAHKAEHQDFVVRMLDVQRDVTQGLSTISDELIDYLVSWLYHHILNTDKVMAISLVKGIDAEQVIIDKEERDEIMKSHLYFALRESESRFRELSDNISVLIWITNKHNIPIFCNQFWCSMFNLQPDKVTQKQWLDVIHPDDRDKVTEAYIRAAEQHSKFKIEYRLQRGDKTVWIFETAVPRMKKNGNFAGLMGCGMDITSQKQAEAALARYNQELEEVVEKRTQQLIEINRTLEFEKNQQVLLNEQLQQTQANLIQSEKMASIGQLAAGVAHEINNPLGYINSNLASLKQYTQGILELIDVAEKLAKQLPEGNHDVVQFKNLYKAFDFSFMKSDLPDLVDESIEGATRARKIVQDLRDFSRIDKHEADLFDIEAGLDSTLNIVRNEIKYKAEIVKEYVGLPPFECVGAQINQVFLNLLVNAAQAITEFGKIYIRTGFLESTWIWVEIEDTGKGISKDIQSKIFDPFFTTKPVGEGTGLGLSLSYQIIQNHNGRIELSSEPGVGTKFRIYLPRPKLAS